MNLEHLYTLGFSEKEAKIYILLNSNGANTASVLARLSNIKRTSVYDVLNSLIKKGVIVSLKKGNYMYYMIDDLKKIVFYEENRLELANLVFSQLKKERSQSYNIEVKYYKGKLGFKELYENILISNPNEFVGWLHLDEFYKVLDQEREELWTRERVEKKIHARLIMQDTIIAQQYHSQDKDFFRSTILLPKEFMYKTTCLLYDDKIIFLDSNHDITAIEITHAGFYMMLKQIFEMNWNMYSVD